MSPFTAAVAVPNEWLALFGGQHRRRVRPPQLRRNESRAALLMGLVLVDRGECSHPFRLELVPYWSAGPNRRACIEDAVP
jgi:hypothetical protein